MSNDIISKGRLNGKQKNRLRYLLDMMYKPSELAKEIGCDKRQIYDVYIPLGCPHERDKNGHIWIHGLTFRDWLLKTYTKRKMGKNEAFCPSCKRFFTMSEPELHQKKGVSFLLDECPHCGNKAARIVGRTKK